MSTGSAEAQAQALIDLRRYQDAVATLAPAVASDPTSADLRCLLGVALLGAGQPERAIEEAEAAARVAPSMEWPHRLRAVALGDLGDTKGAVAAAREAVRLAPELAISHRVRSDLERKARNLTEAEAAARRACELDPDSADNLNALGLVALERRRYPEAEELFRRALSLDPEHAAVLNNLGLVLLREGRKREAVHYFATSSRSDPHDSTARRNALGAVGAGSLVLVGLVAQLGRPVARAFEDVSATVLAAVAVLALGAWLTWSVPRWRRNRQRRAQYQDPKASRELMRQLAREARLSARKARRTARTDRYRRSLVPWGILVALSLFMTLGFFANAVDPEASDATPAVTYAVLAVAFAAMAGASFIVIIRRLRQRRAARAA